MSDHFSEATTFYKISFLKKIQHIIEAFCVVVILFFLRLIGYHLSVLFMRTLAQSLAWMPRLRKRALDNIKLAYPEKTSLQQEALLKKTWANLGNIIADYLFAYQLIRRRDFYHIEGVEILQDLQEKYKSIMFFSGHIASWDIFRIIARHYNIDVAMIYRGFNNPYVDYIARYYMDYGFAPVFQKGNIGVRRMMRYVRGGGNILVLTDQHFSSGLNIPFFGRDAKTAPSVAEIALKYKIPLVPIFVRRDGIGRFILSVQKPLNINDKEQRQKIF